MDNKNILKELNKKFDKIKDKANQSRCVGFGYINPDKYYFSMSGRGPDYVGSITKLLYIDQDYKNIQDDLLKLMRGRVRNVVLSQLKDNFLTHYVHGDGTDHLKKPENHFDYYHSRVITGSVTKQDFNSVFACVERKIIFSGFGHYIRGTIYVSKEPCMLCKPFLPSINVIYL